MRKAIVTGATGFIGRFLVRELVRQGVEVIAVVRPNSVNISSVPSGIRIIECDLSEIGKLKEYIVDRDIDTVFHTAWQGVSGADLKDQNLQIQNVVSTLSLIDAMHEMKISTFVGCGSLHEPEAIAETAQDKVIDNLGFYYKSAKTAAHWMGKAKAGNYGIRFFWPLINAYGEEERSGRLVNSIIRKIYRDESPALSEGTQYYDFVHVSDVAHALYLIAEKGVDGTNYMIGSGDAKPLREFLEVVGKTANEIHGSSVALGFGQIIGNVICLDKDIFSIDLLKRDTGFTPEISFDEGIRRTALWIKEDMEKA